MKLVRDALYDYIQLNDVEKQIIDTPIFQRLRYIKQLATAYLVYPGANHTRFEHSLGCMHLAKKYFQFNQLEYDEELILAALLHDIGHGPFSHESEFIFSKEGLSHEDISGNIITDSAISDLINDNGLSARNVRDYALGRGKGALIAGALGVDRMDYLMRDSYYTGTMYGKIDYERILRALKVSDGELLLDEKGIEAAESMVLSRFMMFATVYQHKTVAIASAMLRKAMELAHIHNAYSMLDMKSMNDYECVHTLQNCKQSSSLITSLLERRLYKPVVYVRNYELPREFAEQLNNEFIDMLEKRIHDKCSLDDSDVIVHYTQSSYKPINVNVSDSKGSVELSAISDLVNSINIASERKRIFFIAVSPQKRDTSMHAINALIQSFFPPQSQ